MGFFALPHLALTVIFVKKGNISTLKEERERVSVHSLNWELFPQKMCLVAQGSASHYTLENCRSHKGCSLTAQCCISTTCTHQPQYYL